MKPNSAHWLLVILSLPTDSATVRIRLWRALKAIGCAALRDGAYLLPRAPAHDTALQAVVAECEHAGGSAWLLSLAEGDNPLAAHFPALFARDTEWATQTAAWQETSATLTTLGNAELTRLRRKLLREFEALHAIDFFPNDFSARAASAWQDFELRVSRVLSPNEPTATDGIIARLDINAYQGHVWATRRHLWVDRVASAWLIARFIDRTARFVWIEAPADCPADTLGFDFDGALFTHSGERVTFETLLASFGLEDDAALKRLGDLVHFLDAGAGIGTTVPEASGFEAVLTGARERLPNDDALLAEISATLDSLYAHYQKAIKK